VKEFRGPPLSITAADAKGNIAYFLLASAPVRGKENIPYTGCNVQDGTTSANDWLPELLPFDQLPYVINPEKGYFVTANNRVVPETSKLDVGATMTSTARSKRITEMIETAKNEGKKLTAEDMVEM
jgi:penicillin amidase